MPAINISDFLALDGLPSLPGQILNVLEEISRTSAMDYNILQKIQYDPAIALRVLRVANTPLYGYAAQISSLQQAAGLLGPGAIKNIVLTTPILERYQDKTGINTFDYSSLWLHMRVTAALAGNLASLLQFREADVCFTGGLIHGTGVAALASCYPAALLEWIKTAEREQVSLLSVERGKLGLTHRDIGVRMAEAWGFPGQLIDMLDYCYTSETACIPDKLSGVVCLARRLAHQWGYAANLGVDSFVEREKLFSLLNISEKKLADWTPQLLETMELAVQVQEE